LKKLEISIKVKNDYLSPEIKEKWFLMEDLIKERKVGKITYSGASSPTSFITIRLEVVNEEESIKAINKIVEEIEIENGLSIKSI